jgi:mRNA interferase MazF
VQIAAHRATKVGRTANDCAGRACGQFRSGFRTCACHPLRPRRIVNRSQSPGAGTPRPVAILQDDRFDATASITIVAFTTDPTDAPLLRLPIEPNDTNGLRAPCRLMVDKITTVPKAKLGARIGRLGDEDMVRLNRAVLVFLGMAGTSTSG